MQKRTDMNKLIGGKIVSILSNGACFLIKLDNGHTLTVSDDGAFDKDGNYFDTRKVKRAD